MMKNESTLDQRFGTLKQGIQKYLDSVPSINTEVLRDLLIADTYCWRRFQERVEVLAEHVTQNSQVLLDTFKKGQEKEMMEKIIQKSVSAQKLAEYDPEL